MAKVATLITPINTVLLGGTEIGVPNCTFYKSVQNNHVSIGAHDVTRLDIGEPTVCRLSDGTPFTYQTIKALTADGAEIELTAYFK